MLRFMARVANEQIEDLSSVFTTTELNTTDINPIHVSSNLNNDTDAINNLISALAFNENRRNFLWDFNWYSVLLIAMGSFFIIILIGASIWYWCNRTDRLHRRHSLPIPINDFIETTKIQEKRLSSSSNKAPPVPPRPTAYTTMFGKVEYRSNL